MFQSIKWARCVLIILALSLSACSDDDGDKGGDSELEKRAKSLFEINRGAKPTPNSPLGIWHAQQDEEASGYTNSYAIQFRSLRSMSIAKKCQIEHSKTSAYTVVDVSISMGSQSFDTKNSSASTINKMIDGRRIYCHLEVSKDQTFNYIQQGLEMLITQPDGSNINYLKVSD